MLFYTHNRLDNSPIYIKSVGVYIVRLVVETVYWQGRQNKLVISCQDGSIIFLVRLDHLCFKLNPECGGHVVEDQPLKKSFTIFCFLVCSLSLLMLFVHYFRGVIHLLTLVFTSCMVGCRVLYNLLYIVH